MKNKDVLPHTIKTFSLTTTLLDIINSNEEDKTDVVLAKYLIDHIYELQEKVFMTLRMRLSLLDHQFNAFLNV